MGTGIARSTVHIAGAAYAKRKWTPNTHMFGKSRLSDVK